MRPIVGSGPVRWRITFMLLAFIWPAAAYAQDVPECRTLGYLARFDPFDPALASPAPCDLITTDVIRWNGHSAKFRAIHLHGTGLTDSAEFIGRFHEAAVAAGNAMSRMGGDIDIDNVTILLANTPSPHMSGPGWEYPEGVALALTWPPDAGECPVSYYKEPMARTGAQFVDAMVHEMFHCIQYKRWHGMSDERWMVEGSAEYFVYLARPSRGPDDIQAFDAAIATESLDTMTYKAVPFFLWLGSTSGPPRVREFVFSPGPISTTIPLDMWTAFGQAYFDQSIHMPDGSQMPSIPTIGSQSVQASGTLSFGPTPEYTLAARDLNFEEHKLYRLAYPAMPAGFRMAWRKIDRGGAWGDPLTDVVACDAAQRYRVMWAANRYVPSLDVTVTARNAEPGACTCPAGTWRETADSTRHFFEQSALPGGATKRWVGGSRTLQLNPDFTGSFSYDSVEVITGEGTDLKLDQIVTGTSQFTWKIVDGMVLTFVRPGTNLVTLNNTMTTRTQTLHETRTSGLQSIGHYFSCDERGLHLTAPPHTPAFLPPGLSSNFNVDLDFTRIGG